VFVLAPSETAANDLAELILEDEHLDLAGVSAFTEFRDAFLKASGADAVLVGGVSISKLPKLSVPSVLLLDDGGDPWMGDSSVKAVLSVQTTPTEVAAALIAAAAGFTVLTAAQTEALLNIASTPAMEPDLFVEHLTRRELEVLRLMGSGSANKEIAEELHISENTVKFHVASILGKLDSGSRTEAVARGLRAGLIPV
jgi:DNA-binding CsgD family transcriptional regulator